MVIGSSYYPHFNAVIYRIALLPTSTWAETFPVCLLVAAVHGKTCGTLENDGSHEKLGN